MDPRPAVANLATVAVLPVTDDVPLSNFTVELQFALNAIGKLAGRFYCILCPAFMWYTGM